MLFLRLNVIMMKYFAFQVWRQMEIEGLSRFFFLLNKYSVALYLWTTLIWSMTVDWDNYVNDWDNYVLTNDRPTRNKYKAKVGQRLTPV